MPSEKEIKKLEDLKAEAKELYGKSRSENQIENRLCEGVKKLGGLCLKFTSPGMAGVPDRIILIPNRQVFFIELKAPGKYPNPLQYAIHELLKRQGHQVLVLSSYFDVDRFLGRLEAVLNYKKMIKDRYSTDNEI